MNEEILGGLKLALSKGESLKQAMMTFYNAGYKREEIEEAARAAQMIQKEEPKKTEQNIPEKKPEEKKSFFKMFKSKKLAKKVSDYGEIEEKIPSAKQKLPEQKKPEEKVKTKTGNKQKVSNYEEEPKRKVAIIVLIFSLLIIIGLLAAIFLLGK